MRRRNSKGGVIALLVLFVIAGAGGYLYFSPLFERNVPIIEMSDRVFWNLMKPLRVTLSDDTGIRSYKVVLNDGDRDYVVAEKKLEAAVKKVQIPVKMPRGWNGKASKAVLKVTVGDVSRWHFFKGNRSEATKSYQIDRKRPEAFVLANSYKINRGGSALVVFGAKDEHLRDLYVLTSYGKRFKPVPYYKEGYYAALIAWPVQEKKFRAWVVAEDMADNVTKTYVPLYLKNIRYRRSKIHLKEAFLQGKVAELAEQFDETAGVTDPVKRFKIINEKVREANEKRIHRISEKLSKTRISGWHVKPFYPLKNGKPVASFGDHRYYYYKGRLVSESYHMGLDLASVKMAAIKASNSGQVVYAAYNGIYGNMPMIDHGLGLYTLYGHCSSLDVTEGDEVRRGDRIGKTGSTGLALGDHLHFGIVVQGVEVRPVEWMDAHWIHDNVTEVFKTAKKMIDRRERR